MHRLLIADDEEKERKGINRLIQQCGFPFETVQARNGEEALKIIKAEPFEVLLTDIKMPFMNGIELIEAVHKIRQGMIYIIYSAYGEFEYAQSAISLGVLRYLLKPVSVTEFKKLFSEVVDLCDMQKEQPPFKGFQVPGEHNTGNRVVKMAKEWIFTCYADPNMGLAFLADKLGITPAYLSALFKAETGQNVVKYISEYRLAQARELLQTSNMRINNVGSSIGYTNESYFIKIFRNREGMSPAQYREQLYHHV
jgi:two-component system response regulator YesN